MFGERSVPLIGSLQFAVLSPGVGRNVVVVVEEEEYEVNS
jgi:hypothetical protein